MDIQETKVFKLGHVDVPGFTVVEQQYTADHIFLGEAMVGTTRYDTIYDKKTRTQISENFITLSNATAIAFKPFLVSLGYADNKFKQKDLSSYQITGTVFLEVLDFGLNMLKTQLKKKGFPQKRALDLIETIIHANTFETEDGGVYVTEKHTYMDLLKFMALDVSSNLHRARLINEGFNVKQMSSLKDFPEEWLELI